MLGDNWSWSLLGLKGLDNTTNTKDNIYDLKQDYSWGFWNLFAFEVFLSWLQLLSQCLRHIFVCHEAMILVFYNMYFIF